MKILKFILNVVLSFLLVVSIIGIIGLNLVSSKILNKEYVLSKLEETEFYLQISREVQSGFENYIYQSGLPEDIIKDLFTEDMIKSDVNSIFNYIYDDTEIQISDEKVKETLDNRINDYLKEQNRTMNDQGKENIKKFENLIAAEYKYNINVSSDAYEIAKEAIQEIRDIYGKVKNIPLIATIIIGLVLIIINIKDLLVGINFISITLLSSGILLNLLQNLVFKNIDIDNIVVLSTSLSNLLINMAKDILYAINSFGNYFIIIGIVGIIITAIFRSSKKTEAKH